MDWMNSTPFPSSCTRKPRCIWLHPREISTACRSSSKRRSCRWRWHAHLALKKVELTPWSHLKASGVIKYGLEIKIRKQRGIETWEHHGNILDFPLPCLIQQRVSIQEIQTRDSILRNAFLFCGGCVIAHTDLLPWIQTVFYGPWSSCIARAIYIYIYVLVAINYNPVFVPGPGQPQFFDLRRTGGNRTGRWIMEYTNNHYLIICNYVIRYLP